MIDMFIKRKKDVLSKKDKSYKGNWDKHIKNLCEKINLSKDCYTTSSCSGRVVLMIDQEKKGRDLFKKVYHELISFKELKEDLNEILGSIINSSNYLPDQLATSLIYSRPPSLGEKVCIREIARPPKRKGEIKGRENIKFKLESCALHVACRTFEDAQNLYNKAKLCGWKKSGIISSGSRFMVELTSTDKLEFPIIRKGKLLVNDEFLKIIVDESNRKLKRGWDRIKKFEGTI